MISPKICVFAVPQVVARRTVAPPRTPGEISQTLFFSVQTLDGSQRFCPGIIPQPGPATNPFSNLTSFE